MGYDKIDRGHWKDFFDELTNALEGSLVEFDIVDLSLGDLEEGGHLSLAGLNYDPVDDTFYVSTQSGTARHFNHAIASPQDIYVEINEAGVTQVIVIESNGRKQFVRLRDPLKLPAASSATARGSG